MKKIATLSLLLILASTHLFAQQEKSLQQEKSNELKINAFNLIVFKAIDLSYERLIDEESSYGASLLFTLGNDEIFDYIREYSVAPYYRRYFSKGYAKGFFVEGFGMLNGYKDNFHYDSNSNSYTEEKYTDFALGISIGGKFVSKKGFVVDIYTGIGRNLFNSDESFIDVVTRGGITLGYRF